MDAKDRLAQIMPLQAGLSAAWPTLKQELMTRRAILVENLIRGSDTAGVEDIIRGRIKELDYLLGLPEQLEQEAKALAAPQQEAELP